MSFILHSLHDKVSDSCRPSDISLASITFVSTALSLYTLIVMNAIVPLMLQHARYFFGP